MELNDNDGCICGGGREGLTLGSYAHCGVHSVVKRTVLKSSYFRGQDVDVNCPVSLLLFPFAPS